MGGGSGVHVDEDGPMGVRCQRSTCSIYQTKLAALTRAAVITPFVVTEKFRRASGLIQEAHTVVLCMCSVEWLH